MTEVLFYLSVGFFGYAAYVLVDEQRKAKSGVKLAPPVKVAPVKPPKTKVSGKTAPSKKAKAVSATKSPAAPVKKAAAKSASPTPDAIVSYLGKHGATTIAKLARELPETRKVLEGRIERLIQDGAIVQTTLGRAKAVAVKG
jgi:hypothetical protein